MYEWRSLSHVRWECKYHVGLFQSTVGKCFTASFGNGLVRFFESCAGRKESSWWKVRRWRIIFICC